VENINIYIKKMDYSGKWLRIGLRSTTFVAVINFRFTKQREVYAEI
jgi:hypothetical protein